MYGLFLKARRANNCAGRMIVAGLFMAAAIFVTLPIAVQEGAAQEGKEFIAGIEDLPVMPGLAEIADAGLIFDKPSGRIVEAYAQGEVGEQAVLDFYQETLPQLGWLSRRRGVDPASPRGRNGWRRGHVSPRPEVGTAHRRAAG
jgi:hypothetical protein